MANKYLEKIASPRFIKEIIKKSPGLGKAEVNSKITSAYKSIAAKNGANQKAISKSDNLINRRSKTESSGYADQRRVSVRESTSNLYSDHFKKS